VPENVDNGSITEITTELTGPGLVRLFGHKGQNACGRREAAAIGPFVTTSGVTADTSGKRSARVDRLQSISRTTAFAKPARVEAALTAVEGP
jgi:hypothetical protein